MLRPNMSNAIPVASILWTSCSPLPLKVSVLIITSVLSLIPEKTSTTFNNPSSKTNT